MIQAIIIEDESHAMELMCQTLASISPEIVVTAKLRSVSESIQHLSNGPAADIIFSDVQLPDGLSFEIFKKTRTATPVIFTTCFDQFLLLAFENNGIDYLLKPVEKASVEKALLKYRNLKDHFLQNSISDLASRLSDIQSTRKKTRIVARRGVENILLRLADVVLFYTDNKIVYAIDRHQKKYMLDKNLSELADDLDSGNFFRANRKYIINLDYVKGYKPFEKVKLLIELDSTGNNGPIIISQETAPSFRNWMKSA